MFQNGIQYNMNGLFEYINKKMKNFIGLKQCVGINFVHNLIILV